MNKVKIVASACLFCALLLPFSVSFAQVENSSGHFCPGETYQRKGYEEYQFPLPDDFSSLYNSPGDVSSRYSLLLYNSLDEISLYNSLFVISQLEKVRNIGPDVKPLIEKLTDQSVFSFAGILSSNADYVRNCVDPETYNDATYVNWRFIYFFSRVTLRPDCS